MLEFLIIINSLKGGKENFNDFFKKKCQIPSNKGTVVNSRDASYREGTVCWGEAGQQQHDKIRNKNVHALALALP